MTALERARKKYIKLGIAWDESCKKVGKHRAFWTEFGPHFITQSQRLLKLEIVNLLATRKSI